MKKHLFFGALLIVALAALGLRGTPLALPLSAFAAGTEESPAVSLPAEKDAAQYAPATQSGPPGLDVQLRDWIAGLASQPEYAGWPLADRAVYPLGPGTHSWLVTLSVSGKELGYLIVAADKDNSGYRLVEYGAGEYPLYSMNTLYQSLIQREIIDPHLTFDTFAASDDPIRKTRIYLGPLQTFWKITIRTDSLYFDAKTGELMPNLDEQTAAFREPSAPPPSSPKQLIALTNSTAIDSFDPFEKASWLRKDAPTISSRDELLRTIGQRSPMTYTAKLLGGKLTYVLAVTGSDEWNDGTTYVRLDHNGGRIVSFETLAATGKFTY